jgi:CheY-like chemotaxis protein
MRQRVLIADDDQFQCAVLRDMLEHRGYEAEFVNDGLDAVRLLRTGRYDLGLLDYRMPEVSGLAAARLVRDSLQAECPRLIAMTASAEELRAKKRGAESWWFDAVVSKHLGLPALLAVIEDNLAGAAEARPIGSVRPAGSFPVPANEAARLGMLRSYGIMDTRHEEFFDRIACAAARIFGVPIAAVSFVDGDRQWSKARTGPAPRQTSRDTAFCAYTILSDRIFVVEDASLDVRFADNACVGGAPSIRFYAGVPLLAAPGIRLGSVYAAGSTPRSVAPEEARQLHHLAAQVMARLNGAGISSTGISSTGISSTGISSG